MNESGNSLKPGLNVSEASRRLVLTKGQKENDIEDGGIKGMAEMTTRNERTTSLKQILVGVHVAFSIPFFALLSLLVVNLCGYPLYYLLYLVGAFILCDLCVLTLFSFPGPIDFWFGVPGWLPSLLIMVFMGFFYAFLAYGLLREKKTVSAIALISSLLTISANIHNIFWGLQFASLKVAFLGFVASAITFNVVLVLLLSSYIFQKFQKLKSILLGLLISAALITSTLLLFAIPIFQEFR